MDENGKGTQGERGKGMNEQQYLEQFSGESFEDLLDDIPDERLEALDELLERWFTEHSGIFPRTQSLWVNTKPIDL